MSQGKARAKALRQDQTWVLKHQAGKQLWGGVMVTEVVRSSYILVYFKDS